MYKHSLNTALLCAMMAKRMNLSEKNQTDLVTAAVLHDIGTLLIPIGLRRKSQLELTEEDLKKINTYYVAAYQMFSRDYSLDAGVKADITTLACAGWGERSISQKRTDPKDGACSFF